MIAEPETRPPAADGLAPADRIGAVMAISLAVSLCVLDTSIANVALPAIASQLRTTPAAAIWVINSYQIAIAALILPLAALAEIAGYRRVYLTGLALFVAASGAAVLAGDLVSLSAVRFAQGAGAAGVMAVTPALIRYVYPKAMLGRGMGRNALVVAASAAAGPVMAGAILSAASWRWLFGINVPFGILALVAAFRFLPEAGRRAGKYDVLSAGLAAAAFGALFLAASDVAHGAWGPVSLIEVLVGGGAVGLLFLRAREDPAPMIPIDLLGTPALRSAYVISSYAFAASTMALVALPFFLQARGLGAATIGLMILPWPLAIALVAPLAGSMSERVPAGLLGGIGLALLCAGLCLLAGYGGADLVTTASAVGLCGAGFGLFQTPNNRTMLGKAPPERSGAAGGMLATARLLGQTGGALAAALVFRLAGPTSPATILSAGGLAALAAGLSLIRLRSRAAPEPDPRGAT